MNTSKPIRVVDDREWYTETIKQIKIGTRAIWLTANRTLKPVVITKNGGGDLKVRSIATDGTGHTTYQIYIEQIVELEFENEIVRLHKSLLDYDGV